MLDLFKFINGTLDTWGLKVAGVKTKSTRKTKLTEYRLVNENVETGVFNNPAIETALMFGEYTPVLGGLGVVEDDDEVQTVDTEDSTEQNLEFLHMLGSKRV